MSERLCMTKDNCIHKDGLFCSNDANLGDYTMEVVGKDGDDCLVQFHCDKREVK